MKTPSGYLTIGREVGKVPMPTDLWKEYKKELALTAQLFGEIVFEGEGRGIWQTEQGLQYEDAYHLTLSFYAVADPEELGRLLDTLAGKYWQDAIAYTVAFPEFRGPAFVV